MESFTRLEADGSVTSVQRLLVVGVARPEGPALAAFLRSLAPVYTSWISRLTAGVVAIRELPSGESEAWVRPLGPTGLLLGPPIVDGGSLRREILGGVLVAHPGGSLVVTLEPDPRGVHAGVAIRGFRPTALAVPLVGKTLFESTQDVIHVRHSRGFLSHVVAPRLRALVVPAAARV